MHIYICVHTYLYDTYTYVCTYVYIYMYTLMYVCMCRCRCVGVCLFACRCVCGCTCTRSCLRLYVYVCMCISTNLFIYIAALRCRGSVDTEQDRHIQPGFMMKRKETRNTRPWEQTCSLVSLSSSRQMTRDSKWHEDQYRAITRLGFGSITMV